MKSYRTVISINLSSVVVLLYIMHRNKIISLKIKIIKIKLNYENKLHAARPASINYLLSLPNVIAS